MDWVDDGGIIENYSEDDHEPLPSPSMTIGSVHATNKAIRLTHIGSERKNPRLNQNSKLSLHQDFEDHHAVLLHHLCIG
jgi:hypothetical protein